MPFWMPPNDPVGDGFDGVSLERVAERAARSRVTLWRQGVTKESLITGLLQRLTDDYQQEFWPVLNGSDPARSALGVARGVVRDRRSPPRPARRIGPGVPLGGAAVRLPGRLTGIPGAVRRGAPSGIGGRDPDVCRANRGHRRRCVQHRVLGLRASASSASVGAQRARSQIVALLIGGLAGPKP